MHVEIRFSPGIIFYSKNGQSLSFQTIAVTSVQAYTRRVNLLVHGILLINTYSDVFNTLLP